MATGKRIILVVEDEIPLANALSAKLTKAGFNTTIAADGKIAQEMMGKSKFDLILLDLVMPVMDGFTFLKNISQMYKASI